MDLQVEAQVLAELQTRDRQQPAQAVPRLLKSE